MADERYVRGATTSELTTLGPLSSGSAAQSHTPASQGTRAMRQRRHTRRWSIAVGLAPAGVLIGAFIFLPIAQAIHLEFHLVGRSWPG